MLLSFSANLFLLEEDVLIDHWVVFAQDNFLEFQWIFFRHVEETSSSHGDQFDKNRSFGFLPHLMMISDDDVDQWKFAVNHHRFVG